MKRKTRKELRDRLSMWEWETLVGAWRYYENRGTATSARFPREMVERFWGEGNPYTDNVRHKIANQFALIDHGLHGEADWSEQRYLDRCDRQAWISFYRFCEAYEKGFTPITVRYPETGEEHTILCFHVDYGDMWLSERKYIEWGDKHRVDEECIVKNIEDMPMKSSKGEVL